MEEEMEMRGLCAYRRASAVTSAAAAAAAASGAQRVGRAYGRKVQRPGRPRFSFFLRLNSAFDGALHALKIGEKLIFYSYFEILSLLFFSSSFRFV